MHSYVLRTEGNHQWRQVAFRMICAVGTRSSVSVVLCCVVVGDPEAVGWSIVEGFGCT